MLFRSLGYPGQSPPARAIPDYFFKDHKPSARRGEARLRGLWRIMYSKTIHLVVAPQHNNLQSYNVVLLAIAYRLSAIAYRLSPIAYRLSAIAYRLSPIAYRLSPIAYRLSPIAYRLSPIAYRLSPIAYWRSHGSHPTA